MRSRRTLGLGLTLLAVLVTALALPATTFAHERRTIASGKYDVVVGWDTEPAFVNQRNAAGIRISKAATNPAVPVTGAEQTLQVQIRQGSQTRQFPLRAVFGQPGYYVADIVPTRAGDYVWTFTGSIGADQVNEAFDTADGKFDPVSASSGIEFPLAAPDPQEATLQLQSAEALGQRALFVAYIGVALGIVGILAALIMWLTRPRQRSAVLSTRDIPVRRMPGAGL